jgi:hypothetical protein
LRPLRQRKLLKRSRTCATVAPVTGSSTNARSGAGRAGASAPGQLRRAHGARVRSNRSRVLAATLRRHLVQSAPPPEEVC